MMFDVGDAMVNLSDKIQAIQFNSPTSATIWWENGLIGHYTGKEAEIARLREFQHMINDFEQNHYQEQLRRYAQDGPYYQDADRAKAQEDLEDYRKQRQLLRDQGIYGHAEYVGARYYYRVERDGKRVSEGSFTITAEDVAGKGDHHGP